MKPHRTHLQKPPDTRAPVCPDAPDASDAPGSSLCTATCSPSFKRRRVFNRPLAAWETTATALLGSIAANNRVHAKRLQSVELRFADNREMAVLNFRHLKHRGATDVLTFPLEEFGRGANRRVTGLVVVCPGVAEAEAAARNLPRNEELLRYILHGALHLLGEDDKTPEKRKRMHKCQEQILAQFLNP